MTGFYEVFDFALIFREVFNNSEVVEDLFNNFLASKYICFNVFKILTYFCLDHFVPFLSFHMCCTCILSCQSVQCRVQIMFSGRYDWELITIYCTKRGFTPFRM